MPRPEKEEKVKALTQKLTHSGGALLTEFRGIKVQEIQELRKALSDAEAEFRIVKNSLGRLAVRAADMEDLLPFFEGSTAIAFIHGDPVVAAKGLDEMAKRFPSLVVKGGIVEGKVLGADEARALSSFKPREAMLADLAGMLSSPMRALAVMLSAPLRSLGYALGAYAQTLETQSGSTETDETVPPEEPGPDEGSTDEGLTDEQPAAQAESPDETAEEKTPEPPDETAEEETPEPPERAPDETGGAPEQLGDETVLEEASDDQADGSGSEKEEE